MAMKMTDEWEDENDLLDDFFRRQDCIDTDQLLELTDRELALIDELTKMLEP